jgi:BirA family biotin operon repressor/biotin-[acetyl-CoA-carboxylase] ligase
LRTYEFPNRRFISRYQDQSFTKASMATTKFSPPSAVVQALNARRRKLLNLLADGRFYSGEDLARQLRVTRSAVWKLIGKLRALGVNIEAVSRRGYRLAHPIELYDVDVIRAHLPPTVAASVHHIEALLKVDSTNRFIADSKSAPPEHTNVCVAEVQSAGRGRRGRTWVAPFASGICLSMDWHFVETPPTLSELGLAVGIAITRALRRFGADDVQI